MDTLPTEPLCLLLGAVEVQTQRVVRNYLSLLIQVRVAAAKYQLFLPVSGGMLLKAARFRRHMYISLRHLLLKVSLARLSLSSLAVLDVQKSVQSELPDQAQQRLNLRSQHRCR